MAPIKPWITLEEICHLTVFFNTVPISFSRLLIVIKGLSAAAIDWANFIKAYWPLGPTYNRLAVNDLMSVLAVAKLRFNLLKSNFPVFAL
mgnify:CR=1 FL=1